MFATYEATEGDTVDEWNRELSVNGISSCPP